MKAAAILLAVQMGLAAPALAEPVAKPACRKLRDRDRIKVNLKPDSEVADVISWYAALTCTTVLVTSGVALAGKKVTILAPTPISVAELRRLFDAAMDSVGLAVESNGAFLRILDAARARGSAPIEREPRR